MVEKIAVCCDKGLISPYFSRCAQFMLITVEENAPTAREQVEAAAGMAARIGQLRELGAGRIICGSVTEAEQAALTEAGIAAQVGILGPVEMAVFLIMAGGMESMAAAGGDGEIRRAPQKLAYGRKLES